MLDWLDELSRLAKYVKTMSLDPETARANPYCDYLKGVAEHQFKENELKAIPKTLRDWMLQKEGRDTEVLRSLLLSKSIGQFAVLGSQEPSRSGTRAGFLIDQPK